MLNDKLKGYKIILASGSPRRRQFLTDMGLDFEIRLKNIEEIYMREIKRQPWIFSHTQSAERISDCQVTND